MNPDDPMSEPLVSKREADAHGQAALLLSESILHTLIEAGALTLEQALGAVQTATEVKVEVAEKLGESEARMKQSLALLAAIELSLAADSRAAKRPT